MAIDVDLWFDWNAAATGLLTNAKLISCGEFEDLPESDPTYVYAGPGSTFEAMYIVDDEPAFPALPFTVNVNGAPVTTSGSQAMVFDFSNPVLEYIRVYFHGGPSLVPPWGDILKFGYVTFDIANATASLNNLDHSVMYSAFTAMQQQITNASNTVISHVQSNNGPAVAITPGALYFYEMLRKTSDSTFAIRFRDPNNGFAIVSETDTTFTPDEYGTYADFWGCASNHANTTGRSVWGNGGYVYNPTGFIPDEEFGQGTLNVTTANFTTLNVG